MHPQADLDRLYRKRSERGRGLVSMEDCVEVEFDSLTTSKTTRQVQLVCDSPNSLQDKTNYLHNIFSKIDYSTDFVRWNTHSNTDSNIDQY